MQDPTPLIQDLMPKPCGHRLTGRPLGGDGFVAELERRLGRVLGPGKPGPKPGTPKRPIGSGT